MNHKHNKWGQSKDSVDPKTNNTNLRPTLAPAILQPLTQIQLAALELYDAGFNVMPIPRVGLEYGGKKPPYGRFYYLFTTRLYRASLAILFKRANLAVLCGRLSRNLFVLDCDESRLFGRIGWELKKREIPTWAVQSKRGGHYWMLCSEGEVKNKDNLMPGLQVIGNCQYVVAPPSVHPTGLIYSWTDRDGDLPPSITLETLDFIPGLSVLRPKWGKLPAVAHRVLVDKDLGDYTTNSEAELAAAMSLTKAGYTENEIITLFEQHRPPHYASKKNPSSWFERYLLPKAVEFEDANPRSDDLKSWAESRPWPGRTGETDKRVFIALCHRAKLDGRKCFRASIREIAEIANITKNTAVLSIHRLISSGLISFAGIDEKSRACLYSFNARS